MELTELQVTELSAAIGATPPVDADSLVKSVAAYVQTLRDQNAPLAIERNNAVTALSAATTELDTLKAKVTELSATKPGDVLELSAAGASALADRVELAAAKIDRAVSSGDVPKWLGDKLSTEFANEADPDLVMLSRDADSKKSPLDRILTMLSGAALGIKDGKAQTKVQTLSREAPVGPGETAPLPATDQAKLDEMLAQTPVGQAVLAERKK